MQVRRAVDLTSALPASEAERRARLKMTPDPFVLRQEILARWPEGERPPRPDLLWRCLTRGCELGILVRTGAANKAEAFRHGLAQRQPAA